MKCYERPQPPSLFVWFKPSEDEDRGFWTKVIRNLKHINSVGDWMLSDEIKAETKDSTEKSLWRLINIVAQESCLQWDMIKFWINKIKEYLEWPRLSLTNTDYRELRREVHSLKGLVQTMNSTIQDGTSFTESGEKLFSDPSTHKIAVWNLVRDYRFIDNQINLSFRTVGLVMVKYDVPCGDWAPF